MSKLFLILAALCFAAQVHAQSVTPNLGLVKPPAPANSWGADINDNMDKIDAAVVSGVGGLPTTSQQLSDSLNDETGTQKSVFSDQPVFTTNITTPKITLGTCLEITGAGSPEGVVTAPVCSTYRRTDGGASTTFYAKESGAGNTGWIPHGNPAGSGAPTTVPVLTTVPDGGMSAEFALSLLPTGFLINTFGTGIPTIATPCTHYFDTTCVIPNGNLPTTLSGRILDNSNLVTLFDTLFTLQDNGDATRQLRFELAGITPGNLRTLTPPNADTHLLGGSHFAGTHAATLRRTGAATYSACRDNFAATADPALTDDSTANYCIGSIQINTTANPRTIWVATNVTASAAVWVGLGTTTEMDTLALVCGRGCSFAGASSFATGMHIGLSATSGWRFYEDVSLGPVMACVVGGVENACDWIRKLAAGKKWEYQNSAGTAIFTVTESTGAITNAKLDCEATGNVCTQPYEDWSEAAACNNATAALIFNSNTANVPAATCEGTNTRIATADFDDSTDEGFDFMWRLPTGFIGAIDWIFRWKGAATSGAVGWCAQLIRIPTGATSDPALPAQAAGNCVSSTAAGTTLQETEATISGVTCASCVAGDRLNVRISRDANGGAVTDSFVGDAKLIGFTKRYRRAL